MEIVGCLSVSVETFVESSFTRYVSNGLFCVYSLQRERALGEHLASNGFPLWLRYSDFQAVLTEPLSGNGHIRHNILSFSSYHKAKMSLKLGLLNL
jgi:hypothetical protein